MLKAAEDKCVARIWAPIDSFYLLGKHESHSGSTDNISAERHFADCNKKIIKKTTVPAKGWNTKCELNETLTSDCTVFSVCF